MQKLFKVLLVFGIVGNISASDFEKNQRRYQNRKDKKQLDQQRNVARNQKQAEQSEYDPRSKSVRKAYLG